MEKAATNSTLKKEKFDDNRSYIGRIHNYTQKELKSQVTALNFLKSIGILDDRGNLTKNYK